MAEQQQQQQRQHCRRRRRPEAALAPGASTTTPNTRRRRSSRRRQPPAPLPLLACLAAACCGALFLLGQPASAGGDLPDNSPAGFPESEAVQSTRPIVARQWRAHLSRVSALSTGGPRPRSVGDLLGPVLTEWDYSLPLPQVRKSLVYAGGANARLRRVVHDLLVGAGASANGENGNSNTNKPTIKVGAIGGSITHGAKASRMGENDWFSLVGQYMRAAFPNANVVVRNGALPATPSALMNMCLETYVDEDVDLVFVEVSVEQLVRAARALNQAFLWAGTTRPSPPAPRRDSPTLPPPPTHKNNPPKQQYAANDGPDRYDDVKPKVYERLVRKIMQKPRRPAVVMLQLMPKGMAFGPGNREKAPFAATLEDMYGALAQYYDAPWLSFRNAAWRLGEFHQLSCC